MPNSTPDPQLDLPLDIVFGEIWNTSAVRKVIDRRCVEGRKPSHFFLGRKESALLRTHLGEAFGEENVTTLNALYYMGLRVIELDTPSFVRVAGQKFIGKLEQAGVDLASWSEAQFSTWQLDFD